MRQTERRQSVRRSVALECHVHSAYWDGTVPFVARDLSPDGMWLACDFALEVGQEVLISFEPPGAGSRAVQAVARIAHVSGLEGQASGMGLAFTFMRSTDRALLARSLEGRPPPLPGRRSLPELPRAERPLPLVANG
jgi:hypothetical protein